MRVTTGDLQLPALRLGRQARLPDGSGAVLVGVPLAIALGVAAALHPDWWRGLLAAAVALNLIVVSMKWPRAGAVATLLWLPFVALVRRLLISEAGWTQADPLLLVGPIVALFLCYRIFVIERRTLAPDRLSRLVLVLLGIALLGAFNPFGIGGIIGGLAGLIYLGVPLLWFFIGREVATRTTATRLMNLVAVIAVGIACYGLYQTKFGSLPQWDVDWYNISGFDGLKAGTTQPGSLQLRPWGTLASASEYSAYLAIALIFSIAMLYHRRPAIALTAPVLALAMFVAGGRTAMVLTLIAVVVLTALRTRNRMLAPIAVVVGLGVTFGIAEVAGPRLDRAANLSGSAAEKRQVGGLLNPLDPKQSSLLDHYDVLVKAVETGISNPVGLGTGASNLGARVAGAKDIETDIDIGDAFVSFGVIGGVLFLVIIGLSFKTVFGRYLRGKPDPMLFAVAGVMVVNLGQWLRPHYAASPLMWFLLGWAAKPRLDRLEGGEAPRAPADRSRWRRWLPGVDGRRPALESSARSPTT